MTFAERFWSKVQPCNNLQSCWLWTGATANGYGRLSNRIGRKGNWEYAHRVAWEFHFRCAPPSGVSKHGKGCEIDHKCRNRLCVNPTHLRTATRRENMWNSSWYPWKKSTSI